MEIEYGFLKQVKILKMLQTVVYWIESCGLPVQFTVGKCPFLGVYISLFDLAPVAMIERLESDARMPLEYGQLLLHQTQLYVEPFPRLKLAGGPCRLSTMASNEAPLLPWQVIVMPAAAYRLGLENLQWMHLERLESDAPETSRPGLDELSFRSETHPAHTPFSIKGPAVRFLPVQVVISSRQPSHPCDTEPGEAEFESMLVISDSIRAAMDLCHCERARYAVTVRSFVSLSLCIIACHGSALVFLFKC